MAFLLKGASGSIVFRANIGAITGEDYDYSNKMTDNAVESGANITDHITLDKDQLTIKGTVIGGKNTRARLQAMRDNRELVSYRGKESMDNIAVQSLKITHSPKNLRGFDFTMTLRKIIFAEAEFVPIEKPKMSSTDKDKDKRSTSSKKPSSKKKPKKNGGNKTTTKKPTSKYQDYVNQYN